MQLALAEQHSGNAASAAALWVHQGTVGTFVNSGTMSAPRFNVLYFGDGFNNTVANVGPRETVLVQVEYQAPVRQVGGEFALRLPLVVGARYVPPHTVTGPDAAQDANAARLMGISVERMTTGTFAVSGMMAGAAGVLLGSLFFASFNMGFTTGIKAFVAATLGGLGSLVGAVLGGLLFGLIETFAGSLISTAYKDAIGMVVLILILLFAPTGLFTRQGRQV